MSTTPAMERELEQTMHFLRSYIARHGYSPSVRDVVTGLRLSSTSVAQYRIRLLIQRGVIHKARGRNRTITLTDAAGSVTQHHSPTAPLAQKEHTSWT